MSDTKLTYAKINDDLLAMLEKPHPSYFLLVLGFLVALMLGVLSVALQVDVGIGYAGMSHPIGWGFYITNFVFWIGIGHAGTLISAVFYLTRAPWRNAIYRSAEAMTVFAVMTAGMFPILHTGRPWLGYFLIPYPNQRMLWINFKSPLAWDVFAVTTYMTVSILFFVMGLIPDMAILRDEAIRRGQKLKALIYTPMALAWRGTNHQWLHYMRGYLIFAALATPLVFSVHSIVSWDFAMSSIPGWHTTIFAPYFVAGAIFSGLAMVMTVLIPVRVVFGLEEYITDHVVQSVCRVILFTSMIVGYAYATEFFIAFYSGNPFEKAIFYFRPFGAMTDWTLLGDHDFGFPQIAFWLMVFCNVIAPLPLWRFKIRTNLVAVWIITILINIGMWFERFNIVGSSLQRDFLPHAWGSYWPTIVEVGLTIGGFGFFFTLFALFVKALPPMAIMELKEAIHPPMKGGK
ncbi:MAG: polysulfide reductase NrfD [SAR324 cluster bacterium]|nr:polysulfide reductase NrfD [SAR324 cluster bacterium]MBF0351619.1 polysulfide reductase NrfD [SAR324 cluster bacterium]